MISKSILFYWSKGADTRRSVLFIIDELSKLNKPCFLNIIAKKLKITHVGIKKHVDLLIEEKYIEPINPDGKPIYLKLSKSGQDMVKELSEK
ncbi:MAG: hypothetical protein MAG795_00270 [Candidatus Woesearchaeota archaeon]|nr:hypothetical protein [Candidatus Woesearchaeota archaeon]